MTNETEQHKPPRSLNIGCGRNILPGWVNIDVMPLPGIDIVCDLENLRDTPLDLPDESVDNFLLSHVLEHVKDSLGLMQELWRLATPGATAEIRVPHGASDDAWEDPTHIRAYFMGSFGYFSQPYYWRADYGYRGDWQPERIRLIVDGDYCKNLNSMEIFSKIRHERNIVHEMVAELRAVKPIRPPLRELQTYPLTVIEFSGD